ncbi:hypothetical protein N1851_028237 [Merluccius polli]|uniref:Ig-like domain-containing protein n=1 Tax=Merluccius polli TaxID=89951 RepID=A0AA47NRN9_MERPO|nr:hypothetical protein N1851_028237 [Merluccius polli]
MTAVRMIINFKLDEQFYLTTNVHISALSRPTLTATPSVIGEEESVTLECRPRDEHPERCYIYWISPANDTHNVAHDCQKTLTGSVLLARTTQSLTEVKVQCFYTVKHEGNDVPSPHSDVVSITVRGIVTVSPTSASPTTAAATLVNPTSGAPDTTCGGHASSLSSGPVPPAPLWWSDLPADVRTAASITCFHKRLKTHWFRVHLDPA